MLILLLCIISSKKIIKNSLPIVWLNLYYR